ncbi:MAG: leucine-rich repeat domain-containing protein [Aurantibacter sp.]
MFLVFSCNKDDAPPPPEEEEEEKKDDLDNPDGQGTGNDPVETVDYLALKALFEANDGNSLGWNLDDTSMQSWDGVTQENERVTELAVQGKVIRTLVPELGNLEKLAILDASKNTLTSIPKELGDLGELSEIYLRENLLVDLPEGSLPIALTVLGLAENKLTQLPFSFQNLKNLNTLNLSGNFFEVIAEEMGDFDKLTQLDFSDNLIEEVPEELGELNGLTHLNLKNNDITSIPQEICNLEEFGNTQILKDANVACDLVGYQYKGLKALYDANPNNTLSWDLTDTTMQSWQGLIFDPTDNELLSISLTGFGLANIPPEIGNLRHLFALILRNNGIEELPAEIGLLTNLRELFLRDNLLTGVPASIGNLKNLTWLELRENQLESVPNTMGNMNDIVILNLLGNQLTTVPVTLANLEPTIEELHLTLNNITELPQEICDMQSLHIEQGVCQ